MPVGPQAVWCPWTRGASRRWAMSVVQTKSWSLVACCLALGAAACGGKESTGPAPDYTLSLTPAALTIVQGATGNTTVAITRTNFTGAVTLSLGNAPTGVTGAFNPAAPTATTSALRSGERRTGEAGRSQRTPYG